MNWMIPYFWRVIATYVGNSIDRYIGQKRLVSPFLFTHGWLVYPWFTLQSFSEMDLDVVYVPCMARFPDPSHLWMNDHNNTILRTQVGLSKEIPLWSKHNWHNHCVGDQRPTRLTSPEDQQPIRPTPTYQSRDPWTVSDSSRDRWPSRMPGPLLLYSIEYHAWLWMLHIGGDNIKSWSFDHGVKHGNILSSPPPPRGSHVSRVALSGHEEVIGGIVLTMEICSINPAAVFMVRRIHGEGGIVVIVARRLLHLLWTWPIAY